MSQFDALKAGLRLIQHWQPDVLHLHAFWLWPIVRDIIEKTEIPLVYTIHSLYRAEYEVGHGPQEFLTRSKIQKAVIRAADRLIVLSREKNIIAKTVDSSSTVYTDEYPIYNKLEESKIVYHHKTVSHSDKEYARDKVHVNNCECMSNLFQIWTRKFMGINKYNLQAYVKAFQFTYSIRRFSI